MPYLPERSVQLWKGKMSEILKTLVILVVAVAVGCGSAAPEGVGPTPANLSEYLETVTAEFAATTLAQAPTKSAQATKERERLIIERSTFGDGTWRVGTDIEPGTYRTKGSDGCYWERIAGFSGTFGDIIANDNASGPAVVKIFPSDAGFTSKGCGTWTRN